MDLAAADELKCPVCYEIPEDVIFQCRNGHICCAKCFDHVQLCPQCRVDISYDRIRNRGMEFMMDTLKFDCPHLELGCMDKLFRQQLTKHKESCHFNPDMMFLCQFAGINCNIPGNLSCLTGWVPHAEQAHGIKTFDGSAVNINHVGFSGLNQQAISESQMCTPIVINLHGSRQNTNPMILLITSLNKDDTISWTPVYLGNSSGDACKYHACFNIGGNSQSIPSLKWITETVSVAQAEAVFKISLMRFPISLLQQHYISHNDLKIEVAFVRELGGSTCMANGQVDVELFKNCDGQDSDGQCKSKLPLGVIKTVAMLGKNELRPSLAVPERPREVLVQRSSWIAAQNGDIPANAVPVSAGLCNGSYVHVCRASYEGHMIPGQLFGNHVYVPYDAQTHECSNYEILSDPSETLEWIQFTGRVPGNALEGGSDPCGDTYYIGRTNHQNGVYTGKVHDRYANGPLYIPMVTETGGREVSTEEFEILVRKSTFR